MTALSQNIVSLERYPITDLASGAGRKLVENCQRSLRKEGVCLLPGFISTQALSEMQAEANRLTTSAHHTEHWRATPNNDCNNNAPTSTLSRATRASMHCVAYDHLESQSLIRSLYEGRELTSFINAIYDGPSVYPTADPVVSCMLTMLRDGDELGWHYDPNDGVVSLLIQPASGGGAFEYAHNIRAPQPGAQLTEDAVLDNRWPDTQSVDLEAGTLSLFNGFRTLHRVAPVTGDAPRIIALFNYNETPNYHFHDSIKQQFFGRTA